MPVIDIDKLQPLLDHIGWSLEYAESLVGHKLDGDVPQHVKNELWRIMKGDNAAIKRVQLYFPEAYPIASISSK